MTDERQPGEHYDYWFRLYIAGNSSRSRRAVNILTRIVQTHFEGRAELEIIDIYQDIERARADQVIAVPTLIREFPTPLVRVLGDLSDERHVLTALDIEPPAELPS